MVVLVSSTSTNGAVIRRIVMLAAPILINRSMTNYCAGVSGKENRINPIWRPNKKRTGHLSPRSRTNFYHLQASRPPLFLIGHYLSYIFVLKPSYSKVSNRQPILQEGSSTEECLSNWYFKFGNLGRMRV